MAFVKMVFFTFFRSAWFSVCYVAIICFTISYHFLEILVIPISSCQLRLSWLRFDYSVFRHFFIIECMTNNQRVLSHLNFSFLLTSIICSFWPAPAVCTTFKFSVYPTPNHILLAPIPSLRKEAMGGLLYLYISWYLFFQKQDSYLNILMVRFPR